MKVLSSSRPRPYSAARRHIRCRSQGRAGAAETGTVWLVHRPPDTEVAPAALPPPPASEAPAPAGAISSTPQADAMESLIQTTIATVLGPLVVELGASRQAIERQA